MPRINTGEVELYYESNGEGTPLVFQAHHHITWMPFQTSYFSQFYRVITFDRRGTGRSSSPDGPWAMEDFARDVVSLLDALDIERAIIAGTSLGGLTALYVGLNHPDRALGLVVGNVPHKTWPLGYEWCNDVIGHIRSGTPPSGHQPRSYEWETEGPPGSDPRLADSELRAFEATLASAIGNDRESIIKMVVAIRDGAVPESRYEELRHLQVPTLIAISGHDPRKTVEHSYELHQLLPNCEWILFPDSYHTVKFDDPVLWNATVHAFLKRHELN